MTAMTESLRALPASLLKRIADDETLGFSGKKAFHVFVGRLQALWPDICEALADRLASPGAGAVEVERLRELLAKATPGPWQAKDPYLWDEIVGNVDGPDDGQYHYTDVAQGFGRADAALIVAAINALPALLAALAARDAEIAGLREELSAVAVALGGFPAPDGIPAAITALRHDRNKAVEELRSLRQRVEAAEALPVKWRADAAKLMKVASKAQRRGDLNHAEVNMQFAQEAEGYASELDAALAAQQAEPTGGRGDE